MCFQFVAVALGVAAATGTYEGSLKPGAMVLLVIVTTLLLNATRVRPGVLVGGDAGCW